MKNYVITIMNNEKSLSAAKKCIESGKRNGVDIEHFEAITPATCHQFIAKQKINDNLFNNSKYSREDNARAAFCSHFSLWQKAVESNQNVTIFEHDAILTNTINPFLDFKGCISFGKPSYGKWNTPASLGVNPLTSKRYFPGAHAYRVSPKGAQILIDNARLEAQPTDVFLNIETFPFLEEFYPWPVEVRETFTTIQKSTGCIAKHMYNDNYVIEDVK